MHLIRFIIRIDRQVIMRDISKTLKLFDLACNESILYTGNVLLVVFRTRVLCDSAIKRSKVVALKCWRRR